FSLESNSSWQIKNEQTLGDITTDFAGSVTNPVFTNQTRMFLHTKDWTYGWDFELAGKTSDLRFYNYSALQPANANYPNGYNLQLVTPFYQIHNVSVTREFDKLRITFGVKNLFDVK